MTNIRNKQLKVFEGLTLFEQRILSHKLPKSFDCTKVGNIQEQCVNKQNKIIQESKRRMLNVKLQQYEMKTQHYEHLYQQQFNTLQSQLLYPTSSDHQCQVDIVMYFVKSYFDHHTKRLIRQIRYRQSCLHVKLIRQHRHRSLSQKKIIDVYPQVIVDIPKVSLSRIQLDYLSRTGKFTIFLGENLTHTVLY